MGVSGRVRVLVSSCEHSEPFQNFKKGCLGIRKPQCGPVCAASTWFALAEATAGDTHLGGEDFDNRVVDFCIQDFKRPALERGGF